MLKGQQKECKYRPYLTFQRLVQCEIPANLTYMSDQKILC